MTPTRSSAQRESANSQEQGTRILSDANQRERQPSMSDELCRRLYGNAMRSYDGSDDSTGNSWSA